MVATIIAFVLYLIMMVSVGVWTSRKTKSSADYFLGGRALSGPVAALSAQASDMSGWVLMGLPGSIYAAGTGQAWIAIGLGLGTILNWLIVAKPLRAYSITAGNATTLPEFLSNRFHDKKRVLLTISAIILLIFFAVYAASAFASGGKLFARVLKMDYHVALVISVCVILVYTFLGGFLAVCTTDFIQGLLMLVGIMLIPIIAFFMIDGSFGDALTGAGVENSKNFLSLGYEAGKPITAVSIISSLAWGLGYFGMPHIIIRFMAIKSEKEVKKSTRIAIIWIVLCLVFATFIGLVGRAYLGGELADSETVFIDMIGKIFTGNPILVFIGGIFLSGILAAIMSTADSQLIMCSSSVSADIYKGVIKKNASDKSVLNLGRIATVVVALLALLIAWNPDSSIMTLVSDAWAGLGSAFGPLILMALFWKRTNFAGAVAGLVSGAATVIVWDYIPMFSTGVFDEKGKEIIQNLGEKTGLYSLAIGFVVSLVCIVIVSLITKAPSAEITEEFEAYKNYSDPVEEEA